MPDFEFSPPARDEIISSNPSNAMSEAPEGSKRQLSSAREVLRDKTSSRWTTQAAAIVVVNAAEKSWKGAISNAIKRIDNLIKEMDKIYDRAIIKKIHDV